MKFEVPRFPSNFELRKLEPGNTINTPLQKQALTRVVQGQGVGSGLGVRGGGAWARVRTRMHNKHPHQMRRNLSWTLPNVDSLPTRNPSKKRFHGFYFVIVSCFPTPSNGTFLNIVNCTGTPEALTCQQPYLPRKSQFESRLNRERRGAKAATFLPMKGVVLKAHEREQPICGLVVKT